VIAATIMDHRWQLVLDCLACQTPPFSKGTLVAVPSLKVALDLD
jgi:transposase